MKIFTGLRHSPGVVTVLVDERALPLPRYHSPDGFEWGYAGSGPSDLAMAILENVMGHKPPPWLYMRFKFEFVAKWNENTWSITEEEINQWLAGQKAIQT